MKSFQSNYCTWSHSKSNPSAVSHFNYLPLYVKSFQSNHCLWSHSKSNSFAGRQSNTYLCTFFSSFRFPICYILILSLLQLIFKLWKTQNYTTIQRDSNIKRSASWKPAVNFQRDPKYKNAYECANLTFILRKAKTSPAKRYIFYNKMPMTTDYNWPLHLLLDNRKTTFHSLIRSIIS